MLWRLCRRRHPSRTSRSFLSSPPPFFFLFLFFLLLLLLPRSLFILFYPQEEKTARVQRVHLPFRDAYCTLDDAIYRSWALPGPKMRVALACVPPPTNAMHVSFHAIPCYGFSKRTVVSFVPSSRGSRLIGCSTFLSFEHFWRRTVFLSNILYQI